MPRTSSDNLTDCGTMPWIALLRSISARVRGVSSRIHRDERGTISIITVFALLMFTMLLVMITNIGAHIDDKLQMQNAADASTYSGGVVLANGMNGLAFSNHLLCDVFAITAFLREARDRNAERLVPQILAAWEEAGESLTTSQFQKFATLGAAILRTIPKEQDAVTAYGELAAASSDLSLPVFEHILQAELIGNFQRDLIETIPNVAQSISNEVARRHGLRRGAPGTSTLEMEYESERGGQSGVLWRTNVMPVAIADETDPLTRTLPVVDANAFHDDYARLSNADVYLQIATQQREQLSHFYLEQWNLDRLSLFNQEARMSAYFFLWRIATCGQLNRLLRLEYPQTNVPTVLRMTEDGLPMESLIQMAEYREDDRNLSRRNDNEFPMVIDNLRSLTDLNRYLEQNCHFVGVVYRTHRKELGPGLFENPLAAQSDAQTFSQVMLFLPRPRKYLRHRGENDGPPQSSVSLGGAFGVSSTLEVPSNAPPLVPQENTLERVLREYWVLENWPSHWDLLNQNWMVQLVPATTSTMPSILQTNPGGDFSNVRPIRLPETQNYLLKQVTTH